MGNDSSHLPTTKDVPEADAFGGSNLAAKQQYLDDNHLEDALSMENFEELGTAMRKFFSEGIPAGLKSVKETLTPGFVRRFQNKKIHAQEVEDRER